MDKFAKPKDLSKAEEKYWKEAEDIVEEQYSKTKEPEKFWGTVTNIFKAKVEKHLDHDPFAEARKRKKKREKKEKKKSEWVGRAHRFMKQSDLTSTQVPELVKEDLVPTLERIENELGDLAKNIVQGFETGDDKQASEVELKTYREISEKLDALLSEVKDVRNWFGDLKNTTYTDVTGEMPKAATLFSKAFNPAQAQTEIAAIQKFVTDLADMVEFVPHFNQKIDRALAAVQDPNQRKILENSKVQLAKLLQPKALV